MEDTMQDKFSALLEAIGGPSKEADTKPEDVLPEGVQWEEMDLKKLPSHVKKVASTLMGANGARLVKAYRFGSDMKLVFSRQGGIFLNKYQMEKLIKVFGRDDDGIGKSTERGFEVILH